MRSRVNGNRPKVVQKVIEPLACLEIVSKLLEKHSSPSEYGVSDGHILVPDNTVIVVILAVLLPRVAASEQLPELLYGQPCILDDAAHRVGIDRVGPRDGQNTTTIGHDDVFALTNDLKASFLQRAYCIAMLYAGYLRHCYAATSTSRTSPSSCVANSSATARYSRIASAIFASASSSVSPCDQQPGKPGQETL